MSTRRVATGDRRPSGFRSGAAWIAVIGWWAAVALGIIAVVVLNSSLADETRLGLQSVGIWLAGFTALAALTGWVGSIGSVMKDIGRIRVGALFLLAVPPISLVFGIVAVSSTIVRPTDPLLMLWVIICALLLGAGTLLIVLPEHLGIW